MLFKDSVNGDGRSYSAIYLNCQRMRLEATNDDIASIAFFVACAESAQRCSVARATHPTSKVKTRVVKVERLLKLEEKE